MPCSARGIGLRQHPRHWHWLLMGLLLSRRQAPKFKWRPDTFQQGKSFTLPAPYAGINLRDDITALKPNEARVLENWVPGTGALTFREGKTFHAGGMGTGEVK